MAEIRYEDAWLTLWNGDCRAAMAKMPERSVQAVITSPPYFGLRDYSNAQWEGGDPECDHTDGTQHQKQGATSLREGRTNVDEQRTDNVARNVCNRCAASRVEPTVWGGDPTHEHIWGSDAGELRSSPQGGLAFTGNGAPETRLPGLAASQPTVASQGNFCECGAWRGALGLEPTPGLYIEHLVEVFRQVWRVLRDDGIAWLNLGDSYARSQDTNVPQTKNPNVPFPEMRSLDWSATVGSSDGKVGRADRPGSRAKAAGLKPKDLVGIPWMAAFALRTDGWYLRQDIVWAKPNSMPESVEDRPSRSHEFIFMLTKNPRYFYDHIAVKEPVGDAMIAAAKRKTTEPGREYQHDEHSRMGKTSPNRVWSEPGAAQRLVDVGRNKRDVWTIPTVPYPGPHFAVFPPKLVEPLIKSATSEKGCCPECGTPWVRDVEVESYPAQGRDLRPNNVPGQGYAQQSGNYWTPPTITEKGWSPGCEHEVADPVPCTVLDPFGGSGTVGVVAQQLGRRAVLVDLNEEYIEQQMVRNKDVPLGL